MWNLRRLFYTKFRLSGSQCSCTKFDKREVGWLKIDLEENLEEPIFENVQDIQIGVLKEEDNFEES